MSYDNERNRSLPPRNYIARDVEKEERLFSPTGHGKLQPRMLQGALELAIHVLAPVHVGSGAYELTEEGLVKAPVLRDGRPIIPGTSIKGACRQIHEAIWLGASPWDERKKKEKESSERSNKDLEPPSRSGALFGHLGFEGRISFDDAVSADPITLRLIRFSTAYPADPKNLRKGRRFYGAQPDGAQQTLRTPALAIPAGACLTTHLRVRNLLDDENESELGGVLLALGVNSFTPKLGGGKYDAWGWVRFEPVAWRERKPFSHSETMTGAPLASFISRRLALAEARLPGLGKCTFRVLKDHFSAPPREIGGHR